MRTPALDRGIARARAAAHEALMAVRLARDLPGWLRTPLTLDEARARVRHGVETREQRFPEVVERTIYRNPTSPYLRLLRYAGCEPGDFRALVAHEGIEGALAVLAGQGVYVTFDEFKGRRVAVRGSARFSFTARDFDSPLMKPHFVVYTGGTRGQASVVMRSLPFLEEGAASSAVNFEAHGLAGAHQVFWLTNPIHQLLNLVKLGEPPARWFHPLDPLPRKARVAAAAISALVRLAGHRLPRPRFFDAQRADLMAAWVERRPRPLVLSTAPSSAVRVAVAAQEAGIDLSGVVFHFQGEPATEARYNQVVASGARVIVSYSAIESSVIGYACATGRSPDDVHLLSHRLALIERERPLTDGGPPINALLLSTLSTLAPKVFLNTELGDYARIEQRACGCAHGALGLTTHLSEIRSFEKLSTEGTTFARSSLLTILEEVLPGWFGGSPLDYQLLEEELPDSTTRLVLRVRPSVGEIDEAALRATFLAELGRGGIVDRHHAELLRGAGSVIISRESPLPTGVGKVLPFHLLRRTAPFVGPPR